MGDPAELTSQTIAPTDRSGTAHEGQKGCLEGVLGVDRVAKHVEAGSKHHRSVPRNNRGEGVLVSLVKETVEKSVIRQGIESSLAKESRDLLQGSRHRSASHGS
jgi:hypothetical protein